ncbi:MAG: methylmalonyl Co-A mutase-associated GTPase MeaB [Gammaproteobacteria bacterium]|jgi:LAO/AO transport system kinase|nr:methylmalonyl Co-A mutase-associated GTPase MeaB [Gammaproteobacteria bacterium]MBT4492756.1 methylmalonyl Co-A mutase-associated GTPase MeaB [Gammaproteobacteria bacterium]MBT7370075.1 methylmalonyl Co-A mutase-associated GTPase MeaB [Gammaproteobacteria bacterium]
MAATPDLKALTSGSRRALAKSITLIESKRAQDREAAVSLIETVLPHTGDSLRIGISGVPGVGKSTFIESFGLNLISQGKKVAVLAVDPSSPIAGGSILGDKTRMPELSRAENAFIRPSPSAGVMGGIAQRTRESILLCEAAGYDVILIETVGVGQSEVEVYGMVDFFMLLMVPNSGDDLQGIKRGITELVDGVVINKADGESMGLAMQTKQFYQTAFNIFRTNEAWKPKILTCSALERKGLDDVWTMVCDFEQMAKENGMLDRRRRDQNVAWLKKLITIELEQRIMSSDEVKQSYPDLETRVEAGELTPFSAANQILGLVFSEVTGREQ